jgi:hypothetical protein
MYAYVRMYILAIYCTSSVVVVPKISSQEVNHFKFLINYI